MEYLNKPRTVFLEILYGCNLYCSYCYVGREKNHTTPSIASFGEVERILNKLRDEGIEELVLLGGEPLLHPELKQICTLISSLKFESQGIVTNGTLLSESIIKTLSDNNFWIDISFRGMDDITFDKIAGKDGVFSLVYEHVLLLKKNGIPIGIEIDCIPQNYKQVYEIVALLINTGIIVKQVQLHRVAPGGDAKKQYKSLLLSPEQWNEVFIQADQIIRELKINVVFEDGFPFCLIDSKYWNLITACACGFSLITIDPKGNVRYCSCINKISGNIFVESLRNIWNTNLKFLRNKENLHPSCQNCDLLNVCRGGCSASGYLTKNNGIDIYHKYFKPIHLYGKDVPNIKYIFGQNIRSERKTEEQ